jgi:molecular chaperone GrpE|nr:MAG: protein GrpE [Bacteroidota bacterium]
MQEERREGRPEQNPEEAVQAHEASSEQPGERDQELEALRQELAILQDQLLRRAADFENYKKRVERERQQLINLANERLLLALLPVLDDLERSLEAASQSRDFDSFYEGVRLVYRKFLDVLRSEGVEPFESVGQPFDYEQHEAFLEEPSAEVPPGTVLRELSRGYRIRDRILRHARVVVARAPDTDRTESSDAA